MTDAQRRRMDKFDREDVFMTDNAADFPKDSPAEKVTKLIKPKMAQALALDAGLTVEIGERRAAQEAKDAARDELLESLREISKAAVGIGDDVPGIGAQFRVPDNRNDQNLIAAATAFFDASAAHEANFVEIGLDADFRTQLTAVRDEFTTAAAAWDSAVEEHAEAVGALDALFREMSALSRKRSAIVEIKFRNNSGKLAGWTVASHLERAPKKTATPPTP